ncbi:MAG: hypothetical protein K0U47_03315 [Epsilonproteobacteria bacterium]|nr:hypothetical protein [Campylobacterota bacterium]
MKFFLALFLTYALVEGSSYYAKAEPKEFFSVKSSVSGEVIEIRESLEGVLSDGTIVVKIDDKIDRIDLEASTQKLQFLENNIALTRESVRNTKRVASIDKENYERVKGLSSYSKTQKDTKLLAMIAAQNSYIQTKTSLENLKTQKADLKLKIETLKDRIEKKNIKVKPGDYIYKIYPNKGDYVNPGSQLLDVYDVSAALLTLYVSSEDSQGIENKKIYLNDKESAYKIKNIWSVADSVNISSYRVEIEIKKPKQFSKLIKVEFK